MAETIEFKPPKGVIPEDIGPGDKFDLVCTYRLRPNGSVCLVQVGDSPMPGSEEDDYNDKAKEDKRQSYGDMAQAMQSAMAGPGDGPGQGGADGAASTGAM